jgi:hypothetical protein
MMPPEVPYDLIAAVNSRRSVLVLGAGASAQAGYPPANPLMEELVKRLGDKAPAGGQRIIASGRHKAANTIMEASITSAGRDTVIQAIQAIFADVKPDPSFHMVLADIPWQVVVSLAWDTLADEIFRSKTWRPLEYDDTFDLRNAIRSGEMLFVRGLGDLSRAATVVLTIDDFRRNLSRTPDFQRQLALLLQTHSFLFLGFDLETLNQFLVAIGSDLEIATERHFALCAYHPDDEVYHTTLRRFGIRILDYDAGDGHGDVKRFVRDLLNEAAAAAATKASGAVNLGLASSRIHRVRLKNIALFDDIELNFETKPLDASGKVPWTVIFGTNGTGKSSILRAIGLAMAGKGQDAQPAAARLLKADKNDGEIELQFGPDVLRTRLVRDREVLLNFLQTTPVEAGQALVIGFPALRGALTANPAGPTPLEPRPPEPADLMPLVSGQVDGRLASFKQWTINMLEASGRGEARAVAMKKLVDNIISELVPGEFCRLAPLDSSYVVRIRAKDHDGPPEPDDVPFDNVSQGMASIFNWVGILVQRLYDFYPKQEQPELQPAIVLVDEIDAHLHPDWQRRLVELTRKFFPKVQVIATSHSALLAGALRGPELCVLERLAEPRGVRRLPFQIDLYGWSSPDILTSIIFGMTTDRNPEAERRINRYFDLFEKVSRTEQEQKELDDLESYLKDVRYAGIAPELADNFLDTMTEDQKAALRKRPEIRA